MTPQAWAAALSAVALVAMAWPLPSGPGSPQVAPGPGPGPTSPPAGPPPGPPAGPAADPMAFGLDAGSLDLQSASGVTPDYATIWIGPWNLEKGWLDPAAQLRQMRDAGITPAIHLYYWGDDLSPGCLAEGCRGKSVAGWADLVVGLGAQLNLTLGGEPALVVLETEFNKASVARHEPLDALLAAKAGELRAAYPAARVVLGLGGWYPEAWGTWDRAAAASDAVGVQAMAGSAAHPEGMLDPGLFGETLDGARRLRELFGKPLVLQDVAVPSAPSPASEGTQAAALVPFLDNLTELKALDVDAILYRSFVDDPSAPLGNYFGESERHFGLAESGTGRLKPAGQAWVGAMQAERGPLDR